MKIEDVKHVITEHKWEICAGTVLIIGSAFLGLHLTKRKTTGQAALKAVDTTLSLQDKCAREIDADIFTSLATEIENLVLDSKVDHAKLERYYDLGADHLFKYVEVKINQYAGD